MTSRKDFLLETETSEKVHEEAFVDTIRQKCKPAVRL